MQSFFVHKNLPVSVSLVPSPNTTTTEVKVEIHSDFESTKMATSTPKQK